MLGESGGGRYYPAMHFALAFAAGLFTVVGALANWDWFFENSRAKPFVSLFGREGARVFYVVLGCTIMALSFCFKN